MWMILVVDGVVGIDLIGSDRDLGSSHRILESPKVESVED